DLVAQIRLRVFRVSRHALQPRLRRQRVVRRAHLFANGRWWSVVIDRDLCGDAQDEDANDVRKNHSDRECAEIPVDRCRMNVGLLERYIIVARLAVRGAVMDISAHGAPGSPRASAHPRAKAASSEAATRKRKAIGRLAPMRRRNPRLWESHSA